MINEVESAVAEFPDGGWIAYVGPFRFPHGQAGSRRVYGVARSIAAGGRPVVVCSGEPPTASGLIQVDTVDSAMILHVGTGELSRGSRLHKAVRNYLLWGARTTAWLSAQPTRPSHVILYGGGSLYMSRLSRWCRKHSVPLIADVVEWYDPRQLAGGRFGPAYLQACYALTVQYKRCGGIIAISEYLHQHYRPHIAEVITVPPTLDVQQVPGPLFEPLDRPLHLLYFGNPGRKDLIQPIITAAAEFDRDTIFTFAGFDSTWLRRSLGINALPDNVQIVGTLTPAEVSTHLRQADFSVLLRPDQRYAHAGFPTKFVESLAHGTPVICNVTSDLARHSADGVDSLICSDPSSAALSAQIARALELPSGLHAEMRVNARRRAAADFSFETYTEPLDQFLKAVSRL